MYRIFIYVLHNVPTSLELGFVSNQRVPPLLEQDHVEVELCCYFFHCVYPDKSLFPLVYGRGDNGLHQDMVIIFFATVMRILRRYILSLHRKSWGSTPSTKISGSFFISICETSVSSTQIPSQYNFNLG